MIASGGSEGQKIMYVGLPLTSFSEGGGGGGVDLFGVFTGLYS